MQRIRISGELALPFITIGVSFTIYFTLMLINLLGIRSQIEPLSNPQYLIKSLETGGLQVISQEFEASRADIDRLSKDLEPIAWFGNHMQWVPVAGSSSLAVTNLLNRVSEDLGAFENMIQAVDGASELFAQGIGSSPDGAPSAPEDLIEDIDKLSAIWAKTLSQLESSAEQNPASWPLNSQFDRINSAENQLTEVSTWGVSLLNSASKLIVVSDKVKEVFLSIDNFEESIIASDQLTLTLANLAFETSTAKAELENSVANTPDLIKNLAAVEGVHELVLALQVADDAISGASSFAMIMSDSMAGLEDEAKGTFTAGGPIEQITLQLSNNSEEIQIAKNRIRKSQNNSDLLAGILGPSGTQRFELITNKVLQFAETLAAISPVISDMAGVNEPIEYLVLGQTSDELRANGGFISSAWLMEFNRGTISDIVYEDIQYFDDRENLDDYPPPPRPLRDHMNAPVWLLRDATWDPNFPSAAVTALELYELGYGEKLSNVIALNISAVTRIVESLGGIEVEGEHVSASEITKIIELETDENGTAYLQVIFDAILVELKEPRSKTDMARLALAIFDSLSAREIIMYSSGEQMATALSAAGWDGSINATEGSTYYIADSNVGWNKVDRNVRRTAEYNVNLRSDGSSHVRLTTTYENNSGEHSDFLSCKRQWHRLFNEYAMLLNGCYWNYLQIYVPFDAKLVQADTMPLPDGAAYAEYGSGIPGESTLSVVPSAFGLKIEGLISVPAGEERKLVFEFIEPNAWSPGDQTSTYEHVLRAQPGVSSRYTTLNISAPAGYELVTSTNGPTELELTQSGYKFDQKLDVSITTQLTKN